jgi:hypothetical protein
MKESMEELYRAQLVQHTNMPAQPQSGPNDQGGDMDADSSHASDEEREGGVLLPRKPVRRSHTPEERIFHVRFRFA